MCKKRLQEKEEACKDALHSYRKRTEMDLNNSKSKLLEHHYRRVKTLKTNNEGLDAFSMPIMLILLLHS